MMAVVILYSEGNFCGYSNEYTADVPDLTETYTNGIGSCKVVHGAVEIYQKPNFSGQRAQLPEGEYKGTDDFPDGVWIQSLKISRSDEPSQVEGELVIRIHKLTTQCESLLRDLREERQLRQALEEQIAQQKRRELPGGSTAPSDQPDFRGHYVHKSRVIEKLGEQIGKLTVRNVELEQQVEELQNQLDAYQKLQPQDQSKRKTPDESRD